MAAYDVLKKEEYLQYAIDWANKHEWKFYDDENYNTTNADNQICGQTYIKIHEMLPHIGTLENIRKSMEFTLNDPNNDYWWWVDTMYMALPLYTKMGLVTGDARYFDKVFKLYYNSKVERACFDEEECLWYRDERFLPDKALTMSEKKVFWSRGNGWVFAGLARSIMQLPNGVGNKDEYLNVFIRMAEKIAKCQGNDGFWRTSLIEPDEFPEPETSGTVLFSYAFAVGINHGFLSNKFLPIVKKGFEALTNEALEESGRIGWVQVVADRPGHVNKNAANDYAVGTYLLLCKEIFSLGLYN
jgi:rhamnogalacturonyl hydrolase YesR